MTRPADWSPLGLEADPIPGDPERISQEAAHLSRVGTTITSQIAALRKIGTGGSDGTLVGEYADTIRSSANGLADQLNKVVGRYQKTSQALNQWVPELEYAQSESIQALREAEDAARRQQASAPITVPAGQKETTQQKQQDVARARALQQADSDMAAAHRRLDNAVTHRDAKAGETAAAINHATDDGVTDSWWDQFKSFVDHFAGVIKVVCTVLEVIATILAIVALFIPATDRGCRSPRTRSRCTRSGPAGLSGRPPRGPRGPEKPAGAWLVRPCRARQESDPLVRAETSSGSSPAPSRRRAPRRRRRGRSSGSSGPRRPLISQRRAFTGLQLWAACDDLGRLQGAIADIDEFARAITVIPRSELRRG